VQLHLLASLHPSNSVNLVLMFLQAAYSNCSFKRVSSQFLDVCVYHVLTCAGRCLLAGKDSILVWINAFVCYGPPFSVPRYLHLDLGKQTQRNMAHFRLHSHALRVETRSWEHHDVTCEKCGLQAIQDEKHALFLCPCMQMCSLRLQFADLFHDLPLAHKITNLCKLQNYCQSDWSFLFLPSLF